MKLFYGLIVNPIKNWITSLFIPNKVKRIAAVAIIGISVVLAINLGIALITTMSMIVPLSIVLIIVALLFQSDNKAQQLPSLEPTDSPIVNDLFNLAEEDKDDRRVEKTNILEDIHRDKRSVFESRHDQTIEALKQ